MSDLGGRIVALHRSLREADVPHAFGGALALAWCTEQPRGTRDIDLNVFLETVDIDRLASALPPTVDLSDTTRAHLERDGQARAHWDDVPIDLFLQTTTFHADALLRVRERTFGGELVPFLSCTDLAVFKVFFDRTKDWADLEEMARAGTLDHERVLGVLVVYLDVDDPRVARFRSLVVPDA